MTFDKRLKSFGEEVPVSKKVEVLKELGHPSKWGKLERKLEFERRLKFGRNLLDIQGTKSYLTYLESTVERPPGTDTSLVSRIENQKILETNRLVIHHHIYYHKRRLTKLEANPLEVAFYISDVEGQLDTLKMFSTWRPHEDVIEDVPGWAAKSKKEDEENIRLLEDELKKYKALFIMLRQKR